MPACVFVRVGWWGREYCFVCFGPALAVRRTHALTTVVAPHCRLQAAAEKAKQASRQALLTAGGAAGRLRRGLLNARFLLADHAHNALVLAVFGFKVRPRRVARRCAFGPYKNARTREAMSDVGCCTHSSGAHRMHYHRACMPWRRGVSAGPVAKGPQSNTAPQLQARTAPHASPPCRSVSRPGPGPRPPDP